MSILNIIKSIDSDNKHLNPTEIYNEGWMTRLLVYYSIKEKLEINGIDFNQINNWTSEALISSPFVKAEFKREGYTHADMAIGDFDVDYENRGEIIIRKNAKTFGIIEAKMGSNLSQGTRHAPEYNQASRNLACIAGQTHNSSCDIFFAVVAPNKKISKHKICEQIDLNKMIEQIEKRFNFYPDTFKKNKNMASIITKAKSCKVWLLSYEEWLSKFKNHEILKELTEFYDKSKKWNRID